MQGVSFCGLQDCKVAKNLTPCVVADLMERIGNEKCADTIWPVFFDCKISSS